MNERFHPRLAEFGLVARNRWRGALARKGETVFQLAAWSAAIALAAWAASRIDGDRIGLALYFLVSQPLATGLMFVALGFAMVHGTTISIVTELRHGWWGASPVPAEATRRTVFVFALGQTIAGNLGIVAVLGAIVAISDRWEHWFYPAVAIFSVSLWLGAALGYVVARRREARPHTKHTRHGTTKPLFPMPGLDDPRLHHFPDWQRREALNRWRLGGRLWQLVALGLLVPMNSAFWSLAGLLLLGTSLIWYGVVLRACEETIARATQLFAASPLPFPTFAAASARYLVVAWIAAAGLGCLGLVMQGASITVALIYALALALGSALALVLTWRYRHRPLTARIRTGAECAALLAASWSLAFLVPVVAVALIARHYAVARKIR
jgi:MFS family permease